MDEQKRPSDQEELWRAFPELAPAHPSKDPEDIVFTPWEANPQLHDEHRHGHGGGHHRRATPHAWSIREHMFADRF